MSHVNKTLDLTPANSLVQLAKSTLTEPDQGLTSVAVESVFAKSVELGRAFILSHVETAVALSAVDNHLIKTPSAETLVTMELPVIATTADKGGLLIQIYEGTTVSAVGVETGLTIRSINRNSLISNKLIITQQPTITSIGTLIHEQLNSGFPVESDITFQLKPDKYYTIRITNNYQNNINYSMNVVFFQIPNS